MKNYFTLKPGTYASLFHILICSLVFAQNKPLSEMEMHLENKMRLYDRILENDYKVTPNQLKFDVYFYELNLRPDPAQKWLTGRVKINARAMESELSNMEIDLGTHLKVDSIKSQGRQLLFSHQFDLIEISLDRKYLKGEAIQIEIFYQGNPEEKAGDAFVFSTFRSVPFIWTLSEPFGARLWWPCKDTPSDKPDSVDITVTVPENLIVASNGILAGTNTENGWKTYFWQERYPIATYLVSLAIHEYFTAVDYFRYSAADSMEFHSYVLPTNADVVDATAAQTIEAIRIYSELFGPYPFLKEKYGHAEFGWGGGMEHQTITSMGGWSTRLIVHELAHQWWGDMITCRDFHHIWLNEGFATYSEALYWENKEGKSAYFQDMDAKLYFGGGSIYVPDLSNRSRIFHYGLSYMKSAWVLHILRHVVGDATFFQILQTYYADPRFQHGSAVTEDFQEICETVSGMNLDWYFREWIYGEYYPVYAFNWQAKNSTAGTYIVDLTIGQRPKENYLFKMPIDVSILTDLGDTTIVVWDSLEVQQFQIELPDKPYQVVLDPHDWILKEVYQPAQYGLEPFLEQNFPNPFYVVHPQPSNSPSSTIISYQINHSDNVKLIIYNLLGQKVRELVNARQLPRYYPVFWDGKDDSGNFVPSGVYFYVLETGIYRKSKKLMLLR